MITNTTTTTTAFATIILLLAIGVVAVLDGCTCPKEFVPIKSCCYLGFNTGVFNKRKSGVYTMVNFCGEKYYDAEVYCDTSNGGGGWLVVQRRQGGNEDFNRIWVEYEDGFGKLTGEFWYGLRALHCLTGQGGWEMRMEITLADSTKLFYQYRNFTVASAEEKYKLTIGGFQGTTNDPMAYHNGMYFTTKDRDNDQASKSNCALGSSSSVPFGGWWYNACWHIVPNILKGHGAIYLNNQFVYLAFTHTEIKIRPFQCIRH